MATPSGISDRQLQSPPAILPVTCIEPIQVRGIASHLAASPCGLGTSTVVVAIKDLRQRTRMRRNTMLIGFKGYTTAVVVQILWGLQGLPLTAMTVVHRRCLALLGTRHEAYSEPAPGLIAIWKLASCRRMWKLKSPVPLEAGVAVNGLRVCTRTEGQKP
jgi:hypothetical protein